MFIASKLLVFVTQPLAWVLLLLLSGVLLTRWRPRASARLIQAALLILLLQGWQALPDALVRQLEARYPASATPPDLQGYAGIVVLGGALESAPLWLDHGQPGLNDAAERMTATLPLLQRYPQLPLLFTGGEGELFAQALTEADRARIFYASMGVPRERLWFESASRNTHENAVFSAAMPGVDKSKPWLLVTSAWHMPRSMATFQKAGWNVTAYPVDFRTGITPNWLGYSLSGGAQRWQLALHELLGLLVYRLAGRL